MQQTASLTVPNRAGAILLGNTTLFPHGAFPLHIFEPRYRQMLDEALEGDCMFCVGNVIDDSDNYHESVAKIGTIGLIRTSREEETGTSNLLLHGVVRVRFDEWITGEKPYPYARISPLLTTTLSNGEEAALRPRLQRAVENLALEFPPEVQKHLQLLFQKAPDLSLLTDVLSQQFVHEAGLRQQLLETTELRERVDRLATYLESTD